MQHQQYAEEQGFLGSLCPGQKKLEGKTFYLDSVKKRATVVLLEAISLLGGRVESFLHKDVSFVVTGSQEDLNQLKCADTDNKVAVNGTREEAQRPIMTRESVPSDGKQRPGTPRPTACGSRGKALLEKAIRNNERLQRSSVLTNAQSWGVKILYVDDVILYLKQLTRESFSGIHKKPERTNTKQQGGPVVKAAALRSPYLKIEDLSRKYKPLHMQSTALPTLWFSGRFSPFETPPPPRFETQTDEGEKKSREKTKVESSIQEKSQTPLSCNPSLLRPRKKNVSYCECCHQPFTNQEEHLQTDQHRSFVLDPSNYSVLDQLVAEMLPGFDPNPSQQSESTLNRPSTPFPIQDMCELEPLTDVEVERAVQALRRQGSSFNAHVFSPTTALLSSGPASPSQELHFPSHSSPDTPPADILPFTTDTDYQLSDCPLPRASSPAMPVLTIEPQTHHLANHQQDTPHPSPDPYSLPPVLSPQVPYPSYTMEAYSPYSEPPALSPQCYTVEEDTVEGHTWEMADSSSQSVPTFTIPFSTPPFIPFAALTIAEGANGFSGTMCSTNGLECATLFSRRSRSLPRQTGTAPNPKKRCRSASPEPSRSKRRRITAEFGYSGSWTEQGQTALKPESDIMATPEGFSLFDKVSCEITQPCPPHPKVSSTFTVDTLASKRTFTTFHVPTVQTFTQEPNQTNFLSHGGTSVAVQPSWPPSSEAKIFDPALQFLNNKSLSSQDSQRSLSHSTSVCIESALIPDLVQLSPSSSDSDWDCHLVSGLALSSAAPLSPSTEQSCELDQELLHRPCTWMHNTSYESRLHTVLQPPPPATSLCGEDMDPSAFSRTLVQIVEVQH